MTTRTLTVQSHVAVDSRCCGWGNKYHSSRLLLRGKWFQQLGFHPGTKVQVHIHGPGHIEIRPLHEKENHIPT